MFTDFILNSPSGRTTPGNHNTATDLHKAPATDTEINQVLTGVCKQSLPPRSHLQCLPLNVWKLWSLLQELAICQGILYRKHENFKTIGVVFQQIVPSALVQDVLQFLHTDHTRFHLGVLKTLEICTLPLLMARSETQCWSVCCQLLWLLETQQSLEELYP